MTDPLSARVARLEAVEAATATLHAYLHALDAGDVDALLTVFTPDATLEAVNFPLGPGRTDTASGHGELRGLYERFPASIRRHHATNTTVEPAADGGHAELSAYFVRTGAHELAGGLYEASLRSEPDAWRIARLRVTTTWEWTAAAAGEVALDLRLGEGARRGGAPVRGLR